MLSLFTFIFHRCCRSSTQKREETTRITIQQLPDDVIGTVFSFCGHDAVECSMVSSHWFTIFLRHQYTALPKTKKQIDNHNLIKTHPQLHKHRSWVYYAEMTPYFSMKKDVCMKHKDLLLEVLYNDIHPLYAPETYHCMIHSFRELLDIQHRSCVDVDEDYKWFCYFIYSTIHPEKQKENESKSCQQQLSKSKVTHMLSLMNALPFHKQVIIGSDVTHMFQ